MRVPLIFVCLLLLGAMLSVSCHDQSEKNAVAGERVGLQGFLTQMPIQVNNCKPTVDPIVTDAEDPVVLFFVDQHYSISFKPKTDPHTNLPIIPTNFYNPSNTGKAFFWDPHGTPTDCNDTVTIGSVTITGGCSIGYTIKGANCQNDPVVQIIPDGHFIVNVNK